MSIPDVHSGDVAFIGLGGNIGDVITSMLRALDGLNAHPQIQILAKSSLYQTPPWGDENQDDFINACARIQTSLSPLQLLDEMKKLESMLKRKKTRRWGPRTIDLDILLFGKTHFESDRLEVPHPRMTERGFVLLPLAEIGGDEMIDGKAVTWWAANCESKGIVKLSDQKGWQSGSAI